MGYPMILLQMSWKMRPKKRKSQNRRKLPRRSQQKHPRRSERFPILTEFIYPQVRKKWQTSVCKCRWFHDVVQRFNLEDYRSNGGGNLVASGKESINEEWSRGGKVRHYPDDQFAKDSLFRLAVSYQGSEDNINASRLFKQFIRSFRR